MKESDLYFSLSNILGENKFIMSCHKDYVVLEFNKQTLRVEKASNVLDVVAGTYKNSLVQGNSACFIIGYSGKLDAILLTVEGALLTSNGEQKLIQSYDADIGAIGVAKNSGKEGDTIEVYVPI